ncbi:hypothetical protein EJI01_18275 [Variovorax sp. MHTC-1]|nr:hypothetical protein EJI01_18275 [Variovorax sp. MHTC-1]
MLRLGVYTLPAAEAAVIQTIVRLYANDIAFPWTLVDMPPYDALIIDSTATEDERRELALMAGAVLTLTRMNADELPDTMARPIRADRLKKWLQDIECALQEMPSELSMDGQACAKLEVSDSVRFMLRRWPSTLLLRNDPHKVEMASLLLRHELNGIELAEISGLPPVQCARFLQVLQSAGLLEVHVAPDVPAHAEVSRSTEPAGAARSNFVKSLIDGIRRGLSLRAS